MRCLIFSSLILWPTLTLALAPPPINLTKEEVKVDGKTYIIEFKNNRLTMREKRKFEAGGNVVGLLIVMGLLFYGGLLLLFLWWKGWLLDGLIVILILAFIGQTIYIIRKWKGGNHD